MVWAITRWGEPELESPQQAGQDQLHLINSQSRADATPGTGTETHEFMGAVAAPKETIGVEAQRLGIKVGPFVQGLDADQQNITG